MATNVAVIVEDEPETAEMLAEMMRIIGFQVFTSPGGLLAVDLIAELKPNIVLLDQMMPEMSGVEVLQIIRSDRRLRDIPVVIVSAKSLPSDKLRVLDAGATSYLTKPVAFAELQREVELLHPLSGTDKSGDLSD